MLDTTLPALSVSDVSIVEGNISQRTATVTVSLDRASTLPVIASYATRAKSAKAGLDFEAQSGVLTIPAGQTSVPLSFRILADTIDEPDEALEVVLSFSPLRASILRRVGTISIIDDDRPPVIQAADIVVPEGGSGFVTVSLSNASSVPIAVPYQTISGTAAANIDYVRASGILTIPAGATAASVAVSAAGDVIDEPNEAFRLVFSSPVNATLGKAAGIVTIADDDGTQLSLFQRSDMAYLGAFRVPRGAVGSSTFEHGGNSLAFNPAANSLFMASPYDAGLNIAEVSIPTQFSVSSRLSEITIANVLQPFVNLGGLLTVDSRGGSTPIEFGYENLRIGGLLVASGGLIGSMFMGYNGAEPENSTHSHFRSTSLNLSALNASTLTGLLDVRRRSDSESGRVRGGYMAEVPLQWRAWIGANFVTGAAAQNRIEYSSSGPALFGLNALNPQASSGAPLVNYPYGHPLQWSDAPSSVPQPIFNGTSNVEGVAFVPGTRSVIFLGSNGLSAIGYGIGALFNDRARPYSGFHSQNGNYQYQIWAYDIDDFMSVRNGTLAPWNVRPTSVVNFTLPTPEPAKYLGGTAFDAATGRLFVSQKLAGPADTPIIHVYQLGRPATPSVTSGASGSESFANSVKGTSVTTASLSSKSSSDATHFLLSSPPAVTRTVNSRLSGSTAPGKSILKSTAGQTSLPAITNPQSDLTVIDELFESMALSLAEL